MTQAKEGSGSGGGGRKTGKEVKSMRETGGDEDMRTWKTGVGRYIH